MFPLQQRIIIPGRDAAGHVKAGLGIGVDYRAVYVPFYVPFNGVATQFIGPQGGLQFKLLRPNGDRIELFHLKSITVPLGNVTAGQMGGITGNSGHLYPGGPSYEPHLHLQIFNKAGIRLDPEQYFWEELSLKLDNMHRTYQGTIYALVSGFWVAIFTTGEQYKADWNVSEYPPVMTAAQFEAFPVHKRVIR
jgi:hypothetical protein